MNLEKLSEQQKRALLDLLVAGMYADKHLASVEDARIQRLLDGFKFSSDYARQQFADAAFSKAGRQSSPGELRGQVQQLAAHFTRPGEQKEAYDALNSLLSSDQRVTDEENELLAALREIFKL